MVNQTKWWKPKQWLLNRVLQAKVVLSRYFWPTSWILLKQLFLSPSWWPLSQSYIRPSASWAIDSEPIRAWGIIVKNRARLHGTNPNFHYSVLLRGDKTKKRFKKWNFLPLLSVLLLCFLLLSVFFVLFPICVVFLLYCRMIFLSLRGSYYAEKSLSFSAHFSIYQTVFISIYYK